MFFSFGAMSPLCHVATQIKMIRRGDTMGKLWLVLIWWRIFVRYYEGRRNLGHMSRMARHGLNSEERGSYMRLLAFGRCRPTADSSVIDLVDSGQASKTSIGM